MKDASRPHLRIAKTRARAVRELFSLIRIVFFTSLSAAGASVVAGVPVTR